MQKLMLIGFLKNVNVAIEDNYVITSLKILFFLINTYKIWKFTQKYIALL